MKITNKTRVGVFVVASLAVLGLMTLRAMNFDFTPKKEYTLTVQFRDIDGVEKNSPVTVNGFEVGRVKSIQILYGDATRVEVTLSLNAKAQLHQGAKASVKNMGFMGEKYIALTTGDDGAAFLAPGAQIQGENPADISKILSDGSEISENLKAISAQVNELIKNNSQAIDETLHHFASISGNIDERLKVNKDHIDQMAGHLSLASQNLEELSCDLKANPWKLLYRPPKSVCPRLK